MLMRLMLKGEYLIVPKGTKFKGSGKLRLIDIISTGWVFYMNIISPIFAAHDSFTEMRSMDYHYMPTFTLIQIQWFDEYHFIWTGICFAPSFFFFFSNSTEHVCFLFFSLFFFLSISTEHAEPWIRVSECLCVGLAYFCNCLKMQFCFYIWYWKPFLTTEGSTEARQSHTHTYNTVASCIKDYFLNEISSWRISFQEFLNSHTLRFIYTHK